MLVDDGCRYNLSLDAFRTLNRMLYIIQDMPRLMWHFGSDPYSSVFYQASFQKNTISPVDRDHVPKIK